MSESAEPAATGLRILFDQAIAAGGQLLDGTLQLPAAIGQGYITLLEPEPGLRMHIHNCVLAQEVTLRRVADATQPETLLITFTTSGPAPLAARFLSSVQVTSSDVGFTSVLPAQVSLFTVGISIQKALLRSWLSASGTAPALLSAQHPLVLDALLTPEMQRVLAQFAAPLPTPYLAPFYHKIRAQELLYWLFVDLANRAVPVQPLHTADVEKLYQVRAALLASLSTPPSLTTLAQAAALSKSKLKQLFQQVFGTSPFTYYQIARMEEANRLLRQFSVSEVGYQLGFTNLSHFARLFKKQYGLTPKKHQLMQPR